MAKPTQQYGLSKVQLSQIMDFGKGGIKKVEEYGGIEEIAVHLKTNLKDGLPPHEAELEARRREFGRNYIEPIPPKSFLALMFDALQDKVLLILLGCAILSIILSVGIAEGEQRETAWVEGFAILMAVVIVVIVTAVNDYTKEQQFRDLQKKLESTSKYTVIREGQRYEIGTAEIVAGDIIEFKYGNAFPCDGLLIRGNDVSVSEAALTGEAASIKKKPDRNPFLYAGTQVMEGTGTMLAIAVGASSQQGKIFMLMAQQAENDSGFIMEAFQSCWARIRPQRREPLEENNLDEEAPVKTEIHMIPSRHEQESDDEDKEEEMSCCQKICHPQLWYRKNKEVKRKRKKQSTEKSQGSVLQKKLTKLALQIGYFGIGAATLSIIVSFLRFSILEYGINGRGGEKTDALQFLKFFINGITVLVVAVPEGLPLAVTIALAFSVKKMLNDNNLVRHLHSCETMGNATCICSDKTGTLTTNRMTVVDCYIGQQRDSGELPKTSALSPHVLDVLQLCIAVNSGYSSILTRPEEGRGNKGSGIFNKIKNLRKRRSSKFDEETGKLTESEEKEEPLTIPELQALLRGEGGRLVEQIGNPTECALLGVLVNLGIDYEAIRHANPKEGYIKQFTFNAARKSMTTVIPLPNDSGYRVLTKGASEIVLGKCTKILTPDGNAVPLTEEIYDEIIKDVVTDMASGALRTLALAYRDIPKSTESTDEITADVDIDWEDEDTVVSGLTCIGIVGIEDPVRPEVRESIKKCQQAGITVRMVTGDNLQTARSIAEKCGIISKGDKSVCVIEGPNFRQQVRDNDGNVVQEKVDRIWPRLRVLARSSPEDKYTLVEGIINSRVSKHREVVAVTGDGTNDGPALKRADVGFAMGIAGTDVAKEACDIILTDDNFASIVKAVKWGRNVYDAISKFLQFQLTVNVVAVTLVLIGTFSIGDTPLRAIQLLWVNLVMDTFASLALATEAPTDALLKRKPYGRNKALISRRMILFIGVHSFYQLTVLVVLLFAAPSLFGIDEGDTEDFFADPTEHYTLIFNTFVFMQIFNEFNARRIHGEQNVFEGIHRNYIFLMIMSMQVILQIIWIQVPVISTQIFKATSLSLDLWLWCICLGSFELVIGQICNLIPVEKFPSIPWPWKNAEEEAQAEWEDNDFDANRARVLWIKSLTRLRTQIRVVNAFKAGLEASDSLHLSYLPQFNSTPRSLRYYADNPEKLDCISTEV